MADVVELADTGERMVPDKTSSQTFWEHVDRYRFASEFVSGKDVLDIACGEGYGSAALLAAGAKSLIGVDVSGEAVEHAKAKYGIDARLGSAESIPLPDRGVDVVVSFETIEHVEHPELFIAECMRVLRPGGVLVVSTPVLETYTALTPDNPFHCSEMSLVDFRAIIGKRFEAVKLYGQCPPLQWYEVRRGFGRLTRILRKIFKAERPIDLDAETRARVVELCASGRPSGPKFLDSTAVRRMTEPQLSTCLYVVAVARARSVGAEKGG